MSDNSKEALVEKFNKGIMFVMNQCERLSPNDYDIKEVKQKISFAKTTYDEFLIQTCGPFLYQYGEKIVKRDEGFFNIGSLKEMKEKLSTASTEESYSIFAKILCLYKKMGSREKDIIYKKIKEDLYETYLAYMLLD